MHKCFDPVYTFPNAKSQVNIMAVSSLFLILILHTVLCSGYLETFTPTDTSVLVQLSCKEDNILDVTKVFDTNCQEDRISRNCQCRIPFDQLEADCNNHSNCSTQLTTNCQGQLLSDTRASENSLNVLYSCVSDTSTTMNVQDAVVPVSMRCNTSHVITSAKISGELCWTVQTGSVSYKYCFNCESDLEELESTCYGNQACETNVKLEGCERPNMEHEYQYTITQSFHCDYVQDSISLCGATNRTGSSSTGVVGLSGQDDRDGNIIRQCQCNIRGNHHLQFLYFNIERNVELTIYTSNQMFTTKYTLDSSIVKLKEDFDAISTDTVIVYKEVTPGDQKSNVKMSYEALQEDSLKFECSTIIKEVPVPIKAKSPPTTPADVTTAEPSAMSLTGVAIAAIIGVLFVLIVIIGIVIGLKKRGCFKHYRQYQSHLNPTYLYMENVGETDTDSVLGAVGGFDPTKPTTEAPEIEDMYTKVKKRNHNGSKQEDENRENESREKSAAAMTNGVTMKL